MTFLHRIVFVGAVLLVPSLAHGGERITARHSSAKVFAQPGEQSAIVTRLRRGTRAEILERKGRWLKIEIDGRSGWVPRTVVKSAGRVDAEAAEAKPRDTEPRRARARARSRRPRQRRSRRRGKAPASADDRFVDGFGSEGPDRSDRSDRSEDRSAWSSRPGMWDTADDDTADAAPAPRRVAAVATATTTAAELRATSAPLVRPDRANLHARAGLGIATFSQSFRSDGREGLGNYDVTAPGLAGVLALEHRLPITRALALTAGARYRFVRSEPGIRYQSSSGAVGDVAFQRHAIDLGVTTPYRLSSDFEIAPRAGFHYEVFRPGQLDNVARMPAEDLRGVSVGAGARFDVTPMFSLRAGFDVLAGASRGQTTGLEDGETSEVSAYRVDLAASYVLGPALSFEAHYELARAETRFAGPSTRQAGVTSAVRSDRGHALILGVQRRL